MRLKIFAITAILALTPSLSMAMGCHGDDRQAMSCAEGTSFDHDSGRCVTGVSS